MEALVCTNCWEFNYQCKCSELDKSIVDIDNDIADIIIELNKIFIQLQWNICTASSCSGHLSCIHIGYGYIMFAGNPEYFDYLSSGVENLKDNLKRYSMVARMEIDEYEGVQRLAILYDHYMVDKFITLEDKVNFLHGRCAFLKFWIDKIHYLKGLISSR